MRSKILCLSIFLLILAGCSKETIIPVIVTTDTHGAFFPDENSEKSLASAASFINDVRKNNGELILLDNGDFLQGTLDLYYFCNVNSKHTNIASFLMNFLKYDAASVGNHDVEYGKEVSKKVEKEFQFPWLSANIVSSDLKKPLFKPYTIIERRKKKIAVLGLSTLTTQKALKFREKDEIEVLDLVESAEKWIKIIKKEENPDIIIGLFHEGYELIKPVVENVPGFDVVFTGHDHLEHNTVITNDKGEQIPVLGAKERGTSLVHAEIKIKKGEKTVSGKIIQLTDILPDENFIKAGKKYIKMVETYSSEVIARIEKEIKTSGDNKFYLDLLHNTLLKLTDAEISITAPASRNFSAGPGNITNKDLFELYPFDNYPVVLELSGQEITDLLDYSEKIHKTDHPDKRYYNDLSVKYRTKTELNSKKRYKVAMTSYHANNGGNLLTDGAKINKDLIEERIIKVYDQNIRDFLF